MWYNFNMQFINNIFTRKVGISMRSDEFRSMVIKFMAEKKFDRALDSLCAAEEIRTIGKEYYDMLTKRVTVFLSKTPEVLEEQVARAKQELDDYSFERFMGDFKFSYAVFLFSTLQPVLSLSEEESYKKVICDAVWKTITAENPETIQNATEILKSMTSSMFEEFLSIAFDGYIPDDVPVEVAETIQHVAGGHVIIPGESFMAYLKEMAREEGSDTEDEAPGFPIIGEYYN